MVVIDSMMFCCVVENVFCNVICYSKFVMYIVFSEDV